MIDGTYTNSAGVGEERLAAVVLQFVSQMSAPVCVQVRMHPEDFSVLQRQTVPSTMPPPLHAIPVVVDADVEVGKPQYTWRWKGQEFENDGQFPDTDTGSGPNA